MRKGCLAVALALALPCASFAYDPIDPEPIGFPEFTFDNVGVTYTGYDLLVTGPVYTVETDSGTIDIIDGLITMPLYYTGSSFDGSLVVGRFDLGTISILGDIGNGQEELLSGVFGEGDGLTIYGQNGYSYGAMTAAYMLTGGALIEGDGPGSLVSVVFNLLPPTGGPSLTFGPDLFESGFTAEAKGSTGPIVPEPGTVALLGAGISLLGAWCRKGGRG